MNNLDPKINFEIVETRIDLQKVVILRIPAANFKPVTFKSIA